jgi:hypothetical protein
MDPLLASDILKMQQQQELVENPTHYSISVHSVVISVLDKGMFAAQSSSSCIRSHGSNPAFAKKFNIGHWNCQWKNSTPPFSHIARGVCVCQLSVPLYDCSPGPPPPDDVDLLVFLSFFRARSDVASSVLTLFAGRKRSTNDSVCATTHKSNRQIHTKLLPILGPCVLLVRD